MEINKIITILLFIFILGAVAASLTLSVSDTLVTDQFSTVGAVPVNHSLSDTWLRTSAVNNESGHTVDASNYTIDAANFTVKQNSSNYVGDYMSVTYWAENEGKVTGAAAVIIGLFIVLIIIWFIKYVTDYKQGTR